MSFSFGKQHILYLLSIAVLAVLYTVSAKVGLTLALVQSNATAIWPPTGIALAALMLFGYRLWPGIFIGAFLANVTTQGTILTSLGIAFGNTLEAVIGAYLAYRFAAGRYSFERVRDASLYIVLVALIAPCVSATIGVASLALGGFIDEGITQTVWFTWWLGNVVSALLLTPFLLLWANNFRIPRAKKYGFELLIFALILVFSMELVFGERLIGDNGYPVFLMPLFVWVALRFTPRETMTAVMTVAVLSIQKTLQGLGPFADQATVNESLLFLQLFVAVVATTSLLLAIVVRERHRAEMALQEADRAKDDFLNALSHELRNPLASMFGYIQLLQLGALRFAQRSKILENLTAEVQHVTHLLEDLLDLSRIRRGRMQLQKEPWDVNVLVREVAASVEPMMKERGHVLEMGLADKPLMVSADSARFKQILINLLSNAAKFTDRGGSLRLTVFRSDGYASVAVADTGQGIDPKQLPRIFDLYAETDRSVPHARAGLGIGLTLVKKLVDMHKGYVVAESEGLGKGSVFTVSFPLIEVKESALSPHLRTNQRTLREEKKKERSRVRRRVVIVDDNKKAADVFAELLRQLGHEVEIAYSGKDALDLLSTYPADIAILDIGLPGMDGYQVAREILKRFAPHRRTVLIALSGYGQEEDKRRAHDAGFEHYLVKPVDVIVLQSLLKEV